MLITICQIPGEVNITFFYTSSFWLFYEARGDGTRRLANFYALIQIWRVLCPSVSQQRGGEKTSDIEHLTASLPSPVIPLAIHNLVEILPNLVNKILQ